MRSPAILPIVLFLVAGSAGFTRAADAIAEGKTPDPAGIQFFEKKIRPVLSQQCYKCHSNSATKLKGELYLDSADGALKGGDNGPAIVPGHPEKSLLIEAVSYTNEDMKMPPKTRLPDSVVADLKQWVKMGAPWPDDGSAMAGGAMSGPNTPVAKNTPHATPATYDKLRKEHWAWQPLHATTVPTVHNTEWPHSDVDRYLLAKLEEKGLKPVADADRATLLRRVTFDLTGLPPTPEELSSFQNDPLPNAYEAVIDRLLASSAFGERWGRHWLDVVRYAESTGSSRNFPYPYAWRYRNYVIDAVNRDKPYDRFITEQIAGDLLPYKDASQHNDQVVATGFLAIGVKDLNERDRLKYVMDNVDEQIDVTSRAVMAMTVSCARCHDHKFDPIPQSEYYSLAGIFRSTDILAGVQSRAGGKLNSGAPSQLASLELPAGAIAPAKDKAKSAADAERLADLRSKFTKLRTEFQELRKSGNNPGNGDKLVRAQQVLRVTRAQIDELEEATSAAAPDPSLAAMGVRDAKNPSDTTICLHGDVETPGQRVPRGFINLFPLPATPAIDSSHSGRLELAQWLTSRDNPLTARVMVNRIWHHVFGEGLVRTVDNFGTTGEAPSHPELLDALARQFMDQGWSVKKMVRSLVLTHAYQLGSKADPANNGVDPGDRLVWRMAPRRLDAEEIRDAMLAASGKLDQSRPEPPQAQTNLLGELRPLRAAPGTDFDVHRSVYMPILRDLVPPMLELFDFAEPTMVTGQRDTTTVATQALFMMNDPIVIDQAHQMAKRISEANLKDDAARVDLAYHIALSRPPTASERTRAIRFINDTSHNATPSKKNRNEPFNPRLEGWASFCHMLMASAEFRYLG